MDRHPATILRRIASTFLVLIALFVVCGGVQAMPCPSSPANAETQHEVLLAAADDGVAPDDQDAVPSLEDNTGGLDDTFDVPTEHAVAVSHLIAVRPPGIAPGAHAHAPNAELRPPIA